jgi:hypothetical protein
VSRGGSIRIMDVVTRGPGFCESRGGVVTKPPKLSNLIPRVSAARVRAARIWCQSHGPHRAHTSMQLHV